jgi:hypothetical protein
MSVADVLKAAKAKIAEDRHWTQGASARTAGIGVSCDPCSSHAVSWCVVGAIQAVVGADIRDDEDEDDNTGKAYRILDSLVLEGEITRFNDRPGRTHADVLAVMDAAIARAELA